MGARERLVLGRIGAGLAVVAGLALAYVLSQPGPEVDGRVYAPDVTIPAAILGLGAALIAFAGTAPLDAPLARIGMGLVALGAFAVVAIKPAEGSTNPMAALTPVVIAIVAFAAGGLAIVASLVRSRGHTT